MTHLMMFAEDYLDFGPEAQAEADAEVRSALPSLEELEEEETDWAAEILRLDAECRLVDRELRALIRADKREVAAGRMDKATYLAKRREMIKRANDAKSTLDAEARMIMAGMINKQRSH